MTQTLAVMALNKAASKPKLSGITITRGDLNKAIFINPKYIYGEGNTYKSTAIDLSLNSRGQKMILTANIKHANGKQKIELLFSQPKPNILILQNGTVTENNVTEDINTTKRLSDVLTCIYRHVRESADPQWANALQKAKGDRLSGGACVSMMPAIEFIDTGLLPTFNTKNNELKYNPPKIGKDKICDGNCGKCRLIF